MRLALPLLIALLLAVPAPAAADERDAARFVTLDTWEADGPFVQWPATAVGTTALVIAGGSAAALCAPFDLVVGLAQRATFGSFADFCGRSIGSPIGDGAYLLAGAPFRAVKAIAWDAPRALFARPRT